jgi:hypothetical protein
VSEASGPGGPGGAGGMAGLATITCPFCQAVVPEARFCGACGAHLAGGGAQGARRLHSYAAFPDEHVLHLSAVSALFPHLSHRARAPFRAGFVLAVVLLAVFALAGTSGPLVALSALSVPLLFLLYIWEVDPYEGTFLLPTALCLLVGAGLGAGWAVVGGGYVDRAFEPSAGPSLTNGAAIVAAVAVPGVGQLLMALPMVAVRALQRGRVEALDGFVAGATGALGFTLAATVDLMAPWLSNGQLTHQGFLSNLTQVFLRGISLPLVSALTTGLVGASFWLSAGSRSARLGGLWLTSLPFTLSVALLVQIGLGFTDVAALSEPVVIVVHLGAIGALILAVRGVVHYVLLHEAVEVRIGPARLCPHCAHLVAAMAFCPECGVAERSTARAHRLWAEAAAAGVPGTASLPSGRLRLGGHLGLLATLSAGLGLLAGLLTVVAVFAPAGPPAPCNPLRCEGPPVRPAPSSPRRQALPGPLLLGQFGERSYTSATGFSLVYFPAFPLPHSSTVIPVGVASTNDAVSLSYPVPAAYGGRSQLIVTGQPYSGEAVALVQALVDANWPGAQEAYEVPGAWVGYRLGFGEAFDYEPADAASSLTPERIIVLAAVEEGFGIAVIAHGSFLGQVGDKSPWWDGHPSPADLNAAYVADASEVVNSIRWP